MEHSDNNTKSKRKMNFIYLTEEELKAMDDELDQYSLMHSIRIKDKIIRTYGDLRPYIKSTKVARKFENILHDDDFCYFFNWILHKEIQQKNNL